MFLASRQLPRLRAAAGVQLRSPSTLTPRPIPLANFRHFSKSVTVRDGKSLGPANDIQPQPQPQPVETFRRDEDDSKAGNSKGGAASMGTANSGARKGDNGAHGEPGIAWKVFESAATTAASIFVLG